MILLILFFLGSMAVSAQAPYYLVEDYGHHITDHGGIYSIDDYFYIVQAVITKELREEQNIQISKFDKELNLIKNIIWNNDIEKGHFNHSSDKNLSVYGDSLIMNTSIATNIHDGFIIMDKNLNEIKLIGHYVLDSVQGILGYHQILIDSSLFVNVGNYWHKDVVARCDINKRKIELLHSNISSTSFYRAGTVLPYRDNFINIGIRQDRGLTGDLEDGVAGVYINEISTDLNLMNEHFIGNNYAGVDSDLHAEYGSNGVLAVSMHEGDTLRGREWQLYRRPVLLGLDSSYNILWKETLGDTIYKSNNDLFKSIIPASDNNGYVLVGYQFTDPYVSSDRIGYIMRVDSVGKELWHRKIEDNYEDIWLTLDDVIALDNGEYLSIGYRADKNRDADPWTSRTQMIVVKFDNDGNFIFKPSVNSNLIPESSKILSVFPNPSNSEFIVNSNYMKNLVLRLVDINGNDSITKSPLLANESKVINIVGLPSGTYTLLAHSEDGDLITSEKLIVQ